MDSFIVRTFRFPEDLEPVRRLWTDYLTWGNNEMQARFGVHPHDPAETVHRVNVRLVNVASKHTDHTEQTDSHGTSLQLYQHFRNAVVYLKVVHTGRQHIYIQQAGIPFDFLV